MFSVSEYYRFNKTFAKTTRHLQKFSELDAAKAFADGVYQEIKRIPESEAVFVGVLDEDKGKMMYTQPEEPFPDAKQW